MEDQAEGMSLAIDSCDLVAPFGCYAGDINVPHKLPGMDWSTKIGINISVDSNGNPTAKFDKDFTDAWNSAQSSEDSEIEKLCKPKGRCCCKKIVRVIECQPGYDNPKNWKDKDVNWVVALMLEVLRQKGGITGDEPVCNTIQEYDCKNKTWSPREAR